MFRLLCLNSRACIGRTDGRSSMQKYISAWNTRRLFEIGNIVPLAPMNAFLYILFFILFYFFGIFIGCDNRQCRRNIFNLLEG